MLKTVSFAQEISVTSWLGKSVHQIASSLHGNQLLHYWIKISKQYRKFVTQTEEGQLTALTVCQPEFNYVAMEPVHNNNTLGFSGFSCSVCIC